MATFLLGILVGVFGSVFIFPLTIVLWRLAQIVWTGRLPESEYPALIQRYADLGTALQRDQASSQPSTAAALPASPATATPEAVTVPDLDRPMPPTPAPEVEWAPLVAADGTPLPPSTQPDADAPEPAQSSAGSSDDLDQMVSIPRWVLKQFEEHFARLGVLEARESMRLVNRAQRKRRSSR